MNTIRESLKFAIIGVILIFAIIGGLIFGLKSCELLVDSKQEEPTRVHIYGRVVLNGTEYIEGYVCFRISDYNPTTKQVKLRGLERYGWMTIYNGDLYYDDEPCPYCGYKTANIIP